MTRARGAVSIHARACSLAALVIAVLVTGCSPSSTAGGDATAAADPSVSSSLPASSGFHAGPDSLSGRVVRLSGGVLVIDSAGHEFDVRLDRSATIWKETAVSASALEIGDNLLVNGTAGTPFVATYVWANIGQIDGVIRDIDASGMLVEVSLRSGGTTLRRVDFSQYIEYGSADGSVKITNADLVIGRSISAVVYSPRGAALRATRVW
jgi:hypothetical protein